MEKKILGLDLGSASIGWAVVREGEGDGCPQIVALGSRIIPLSADDANQFTTGQAISKNADRTRMRTQRKGYDRFQMRRAALQRVLCEWGLMYGDELKALSPQVLWGLRAKAATERVSLPELGRVLFHLNQKRGYKPAKGDLSDNERSKYLKAVNGRYDELQERKQTIGQFMYEALCADPTFRCKDRVYPRRAYIEEFDAIVGCQRRFYPEVLTDERIEMLRNRIIYYQRPLKSCKHLVSLCEFEKRSYRDREGKIVYNGPKVAARTSPLAQVCKIWESINHIRVKNRRGDELYIAPEQKQALFAFMNTHEKLKLQDFYKILGISKADGWSVGQAIGRGLQGNTTRTAIAAALGDASEAERLLRFRVEEVDSNRCDPETGEIVPVISPACEQEPLYRLWHALYSISDPDELAGVLERSFGITDRETIGRLCALDFVKAGYGSLSNRAMRRILPYLQLGMVYSEACEAAGFRHSDSLTAEENRNRALVDRLQPILRGELRQPVVEKILNQMINVVNALMVEYGRFDEIRIELARELKQSREERAATYKAMRENERNNEQLARRILEQDDGTGTLVPTRSRIQKMKLWKESKQFCMYCGKTVNVKEFLLGFDVEVEHIVPRSLLLDDSFSNKVCACRACNREKGNRTAYDYMQSKGDAAFQDYLDRVNRYYEEKSISKSKYEKLLMPGDKIPDGFIDRQLRESQYIARQAQSLLRQVCYQVSATSGSVTDLLRRLWGWDRVLHDLNLERYRKADLIEIREYAHKDSTQREERIIGWSKRLDHRHHAVDALVIACTRQGYIQRINTVNAMKEEDFVPLARQSGESRERMTRLERYLSSQPHLSVAAVAEAVERISVSFKAGKRVAVPGKRYIHRGGKRELVQRDIVVPRGALSEDTVYGRIRRYVRDPKQGKTALRPEYVVKYPLEKIDRKKLADVVDGGVREVLRQRLEAYGDKPKQAYAEPVIGRNGLPIRTVRCRTGLSAVAPVRYNDAGEAIGFVKPGNNHHVAIYTDESGKRYEHVVTFWHAVERKRAGLPIVIERPAEVWDALPIDADERFFEQLPKPTWRFEMSMQQNDMFILGLPDEVYRDALEHGDNVLLNRHLYRVQKLAVNNYAFRFHTETTVDDQYVGPDGVKKKNETLSKSMGKVVIVQSLKTFESWYPHKVRVSLTGKIAEI